MPALVGKKHIFPVQIITTKPDRLDLAAMIESAEEDAYDEADVARLHAACRAVRVTDITLNDGWDGATVDVRAGGTAYRAVAYVGRDSEVHIYWVRLENGEEREDVWSCDVPLGNDASLRDFEPVIEATTRWMV